jgi:hypothetical protein
LSIAALKYLVRRLRWGGGGGGREEERGGGREGVCELAKTDGGQGKIESDRKREREREGRERELAREGGGGGVRRSPSHGSLST